MNVPFWNGQDHSKTEHHLKTEQTPTIWNPNMFGIRAPTVLKLNYQVHMETFHNELALPEKCPECGKQFRTTHAVKQHQARVHRVIWNFLELLRLAQTQTQSTFSFWVLKSSREIPYFVGVFRTAFAFFILCDWFKQNFIKSRH